MKRWRKANNTMMNIIKTIKEDKNMKAFKKICKMEQVELKRWLTGVLNVRYREVISGDGFLYAKGNVPILLTAHMDTVHADKHPQIVVKKTKDGTILSAPQGIGGDDRCGIWIIYKLITRSKYRPSILFCEDEEIGGVGSDKFTRTDYIDDLKQMKYLVELDRMSGDDAVYYDCGNKEFMEYIENTIGYKFNTGSFSDISHLSPECDVASVNIGCGYYRQHTLEEYVVFEEMLHTYKMVKKLMADVDNAKHYDYQEIQYTRGRYGYYDYSRYNYGTNYFKSLFEDEEDDAIELDKVVMGSRDVDDYKYETWKERFVEFIFEKDGKEQSACYSGDTFAESLGQFLIDYPDLRFNDILDYYEY